MHHAGEPHPDTIPKHTTQSEPAPGASKPPKHTPGENPTTPPESAKELPKLTLVELRAYVAEKSTPENRPRIKAILEKLGVRKLTDLPEDHYSALMREVAAL